MTSGVKVTKLVVWPDLTIDLSLPKEELKSR